jgi:competence protein ComEA
MLTAEEKRAVLFLTAVAAAGGVVRILRAPEPPPAIAVAPEIRGDDVQRQAALARRREAEMLRPLGPGEKIDIDRASARELERLPGVGPQLARRMVQDREANGAFGGLAALDAVPGVGPAMLAGIGPHATFSGPPRLRAEPQAGSRVESRRRSALRSGSTRPSLP